MNDNPGLNQDPASIRARAKIARTTRRKLHTTRSRRNNPITQYYRDEAAATRPLDDFAGQHRPLTPS